VRISVVSFSGVAWVEREWCHDVLLFHERQIGGKYR
jgi:hypothetical protein